MKLSLICIFIVLVTTAHAQIANWVRFAPRGEHFELDVPGDMRSAQKKLLTPIGELVTNTWMHQGVKDDDNAIYTVSCIYYPSGTFPKDSTDLREELFAETIDAHIQDLDGKLDYDSPTFVTSDEGRIYRVSYNKGKATMKSRLFVINDIFYALQVYTLSTNSLNPFADKFLNSFKIVRDK